MRFDSIIMNPPYKKGLCNKILKNLIISNITNELVSIQPYSAFTSISKAANKLRKLAKWKHIIIKNPCTIWKQLSFNSAIAILNYVKNNNNKVLIKNELDWYGNNNVYIEKETLCFPIFGEHILGNKIIKKCSVHINNSILNLTNTKKQFSLDKISICGHMYNKNGTGKDILWIRYKGSKDKTLCSNKLNAKHFDSFGERENFINYSHSSFFSLMLSKTKRDYHVCDFMQNYIPLFDFNYPVTNEIIQNTFNLTNLEMKFIDDFGKQLNKEIIDWRKYD